MGILTKITKEYFGSSVRKESRSAFEDILYDWIEESGVKFIPVELSDGTEIEIADMNFLANSVEDFNINYDRLKSVKMEFENTDFDLIDCVVLYDAIKENGKYINDGKSFSCEIDGKEFIIPISDGEIKSATYITRDDNFISIFDNGKNDKSMIFETNCCYRDVDFDKSNIFYRLTKKKR